MLRADIVSQSAQTSTDNLPYPQGRQFPLGLYSLETKNLDEIRKVSNSGWNLGHSYGNQDDLLERVAQGDMFAFAHIEEKDGLKAKSLIEKMADNSSVAWWDLPEEQRYWRKGEFDLIKNYNKWARQHDTKQRPIFSYLPNHYSSAAIAHYVPYRRYHRGWNLY